MPRTIVPSPTLFLKKRFPGRGNRLWFSHCHSEPAHEMRAEDLSELYGSYLTLLTS